jgi:hypothetical protein
MIRRSGGSAGCSMPILDWSSARFVANVGMPLRAVALADS